MDEELNKDPRNLLAWLAKYNEEGDEEQKTINNFVFNRVMPLLCDIWGHVVSPHKYLNHNFCIYCNNITHTKTH